MAMWKKLQVTIRQMRCGMDKVRPKMRNFCLALDCVMGSLGIFGAGGGMIVVASQTDGS